MSYFKFSTTSLARDSLGLIIVVVDVVVAKAAATAGARKRFNRAQSFVMVIVSCLLFEGRKTVCMVIKYKYNMEGAQSTASHSYNLGSWS